MLRTAAALPAPHRASRRDAARPELDGARRPVRRQRPHHRRARHGQGGRRALAPRRLARAPKPLVTVNAGGLAEGIFESELFGHVRGAFTDAKTDRVGCFELADGGTLFLDEIANVAAQAAGQAPARACRRASSQRVGSSQTRRVDVRVLSATNTDLNEEVAAGRFREDLFFRLNTVEIHLPPLRDRREDCRRSPSTSSATTRTATASRCGTSPPTPCARSSSTTRIRNFPFLSDEYLDALRFVSAKARELGMRMDLTLGSGWPLADPC